VNRKLTYTEREEGMEGNDMCAALSCLGRTRFEPHHVVTPDGGLKKQTEACCVYNVIQCPHNTEVVQNGTSSLNYVACLFDTSQHKYGKKKKVM
jgi:hypothetical protein